MPSSSSINSSSGLSNLPTDCQPMSNTLVPPPLSDSVPCHPMITRSKVGVFKPKSFLFNLSSTKPTTVQQALSHPGWKQAMDFEYRALL